MLDNNGVDRHRSMRYLWGYAILLLAVSLLLIFLSYGSQERLKRQLLSADHNLAVQAENADDIKNTVKLQKQIINSMNGSMKDISLKINELSELAGELENDKTQGKDGDVRQTVLKIQRIADEISEEVSKYSS